jgi:hypothetical protein
MARLEDDSVTESIEVVYSKEVEAYIGYEVLDGPDVSMGRGGGRGSICFTEGDSSLAVRREGR